MPLNALANRRICIQAVLLVLLMGFPLSASAQSRMAMDNARYSSSSVKSLLQEFRVRPYFGLGVSMGDAQEETLEISIKSGMSAIVGIQLQSGPSGQPDPLSWGIDIGLAMDLLDRHIYRTANRMSGYSHWSYPRDKNFKQSFLYLIPFIHGYKSRVPLFFQIGIGVHYSWWSTNWWEGSRWSRFEDMYTGPSFSFSLGYQHLTIRIIHHRSRAGIRWFSPRGSYYHSEYVDQLKASTTFITIGLVI